MAAGNLLTEKLYLRTEMTVPLTTLQHDENHQYVANVWKTGRAYKVGMIVYYSLDINTDGTTLGNLAWYVCQETHTAGTFNSDVSSNKWKQIGEGTGANILVNGITYPGITLGLGLGIDDCGVLSNTMSGFWEQTTDADAITYSSAPVLVGDTTLPSSGGEQLQVVGNTFITGNILISGTVDGIDLSGFFGVNGSGIASGETWNDHRHTLGVDAAYHSQLADVSITSLANNDVLQYNSSLNKWENKAVSNLIATHTLGAGQTDVNAAVSTSPALNQIFYYNGGQWDKLTVGSSNNTGLTGGPFPHTHDGRYYTKTQLSTNGALDSRYYTETEMQTSGGASIHFDNLTNLPSSISGETIYSGDGNLSADREVYLNSFTLKFIQGTASQPFNTGLTITPDGLLAIGTLTQAPAAPLEIYKQTGTDDIEPHLRISVEQDSSVYTDFTVQSHGPAGSLRISPSGSGGVKIVPTTNNVNTFQVFQISNADGAALSRPIFNVDSSNRRAGINVALPEAALHVMNDDAGEVTFVAGDMGTSENIFVVAGDGKVGVNISDYTPSAELQVGGAAILSGTVTAQIDEATTNYGKVLTCDADGKIIYRTTADFREDLNILPNTIWLSNTAGSAYLNGEILRLGIGYDKDGFPLTDPEGQLHILAQDDDYSILITDNETNDGTHFAVDNHGAVALNVLHSSQFDEGGTPDSYMTNAYTNILIGGSTAVNSSTSLSFGNSVAQQSQAAITYNNEGKYLAISRITRETGTISDMHTGLPSYDGAGYEQFLIDMRSAPNSLRVGIPLGVAGASGSTSVTGAGYVPLFDRAAVAIGTPHGESLDAALTISGSSYNLLRIKDDSTSQGTFVLVDSEGDTTFKPAGMSNGKNLMKIGSGFINGRELPMVHIGGPSDQAGTADNSSLLIYADGQDALTVVDNTTSQHRLFTIRDSAAHVQGSAQGGTQFYPGHVTQSGASLPAMMVAVTGESVYDNIYPAIGIGALPQQTVTLNVEGNQNQGSILQLADRESTGNRIKMFDFKIDQMQPKLGIGEALDPDATLHIYSSGIDALKIEDGSTNSSGNLMRITDDNVIYFHEEMIRGSVSSSAMSIHTKTNAATGVTVPIVSIGSITTPNVYGSGNSLDNDLTAALTIRTEDQHAFIIRDGSTGNGTQFMVDSRGDVLIGADHNADTSSPNAKLYIRSIRGSGSVGANPWNEVAFRIDNSDTYTGLDTTPFIVRNGDLGDTDFHIGINKLEPTRTLDIYSAGNGQIWLESLGNSTLTLQADSDVTDGSGTSNAALTLSSGGSFNWSIVNDQDGFNESIGGQRGDRNILIIKNPNTTPVVIQQEAADYSLTLLENARTLAAQQFNTPAVMIGNSSFVISQADTGDAPSLSVVTNGNGGLQVTDGSTADGTLFKVHNEGNVEFAAGQVYSFVKDKDAISAVTVINFDEGNTQRVRLVNPHTNLSFTGHKAGASYTIFIIQDDQGNRTMDIEETTGGYDIFWQSGVVPVLSTSPDAVDIITFISDGYNLYGSAGYNFQRVNINQS